MTTAILASRLQSPVTYQGGKSRLANEIVARIMPDVSKVSRFYDVCCGTGAVTLAAIERGLDPLRITMIDVGLWGDFWSLVGCGTLDMEALRRVIVAVPTDPREIKDHAEYLFRCAPDVQTSVHEFLVLQAAAIGGAPIWIDKGRWVRHSGFRDYWMPTATSSRRSPVNPMMPMPNTILSRVSAVVRRALGVRVLTTDVRRALAVEDGAVVYIDPPYRDTTGYGFLGFDVEDVACRMSANATVHVSETKPLTSVSHQLSVGRAKGGMTGNRRCRANEEWLSTFPATPEVAP